LEARELEDYRAITEDDLVVGHFNKGEPLYDMPAADRYCKEHGLSMEGLTAEDWKRFIFDYHS